MRILVYKMITLMKKIAEIWAVSREFGFDGPLYTPLSGDWDIRFGMVVGAHLCIIWKRGLWM
jgi:hypothetical protein